MSKWTENENLLLEQNYQLKKSDILKLFPHRTAAAINIQASKLRLRKIYNEYVKSDMSPLLSDTYQAYYWIGFILADGHITPGNRLQITLSIKDYDHLLSFSQFIKTNIKLTNNKQSCYISCQDKYYIPKLRDKFQISNLKTYGPPRNLVIDSDKLFLSLFCGFVDGDGRITNQYKRKDCFLSIHIHSSWENIVNGFMSRINKIFDTDSPLGEVKNDGYYLLNISNSAILSKLKKFTIENSLPVLQRKWSNIDENFISRQITARENRETISKLLNSEMSIKQIADTMNLTYGSIYQQIKRHNIT
jgi:hypothetical protein